MEDEKKDLLSRLNVFEIKNNVHQVSSHQLSARLAARVNASKKEAIVFEKKIKLLEDEKKDLLSRLNDLEI